MRHKLVFEECVDYCGFDNLPEGLNAFYEGYVINTQQYLISRSFLANILHRFNIPVDKQNLIVHSLEAIEQDKVLFHFTKFIVWNMCNTIIRCDANDYKSLTPTCMPNYSELYSFLVLLACVEPSMQLLKERCVPSKYYENIPYQPIEKQLKRLVEDGDATVVDFPWDLNFYTCSIFLMDRFLFIPYRFEDKFTMYRNVTTKKVMAIRHAGEEFRRDGQLNGINEVFDQEGKFTSKWVETEHEITGNPIQPMGYVKQEMITIKKNEWEIALKQGDILLALHVPAGPGYTPKRLKNSMQLVIAFYDKYYTELKIKGFWSESWLYDSRLSLILDNEKSNIVQVQRQFYLYPIQEGDGMLRYEVFGDWKADPLQIEAKTSLQKATQEYMKTGARFNTLSMIMLREEIEMIENSPYISTDDIEEFRITVDSHLK